MPYNRTIGFLTGHSRAFRSLAYTMMIKFESMVLLNMIRQQNRGSSYQYSILFYSECNYNLRILSIAWHRKWFQITCINLSLFENANLYNCIHMYAYANRSFSPYKIRYCRTMSSVFKLLFFSHPANKGIRWFIVKYEFEH